ncbi:hypothetical protein EV189_2766 [Motilibacter rhizosphaerae]|uniref:WD40 repeat protein n=1 Tax=Motilibacter rhizosphaerae TaxID=598652 RepID=A0A4Q7NPX0_9ACTN|nr:hypothetical protein [Motilibacter rhizosphaerae]RZS87341.1 hypothetical protein EV189_2766 [Motilibacter rhizosphaerae]
MRRTLLLAALLVTPAAPAHAATPSGTPVAYVRHDQAMAYGVVAVADASGPVALPTPPGPAGRHPSSPVGWLSPTRLLVQGQDRDYSPRLWLAVVDVPSRSTVARAGCPACQVGVAVDDRSTVGLLTLSSDGSTGRVARFDATLRRTSLATVRGLPRQPAFQRPVGWTLAGVRSSGVVLLLPDPAGVSAYGGPLQVWTVDWSGRAHRVTTTAGNVGAGQAALSPDGTHLAYDDGFRGGACADEHLPTVLDLRTGRTVTPHLPAALRHGVEVFTTQVSWLPTGRLTFGWENSGSNGDPGSPCPHSPLVGPDVYTWDPAQPGHAVVRVESGALAARTLPDGTRLVVRDQPGTDDEELALAVVSRGGTALPGTAEAYPPVLVP